MEKISIDLPVWENSVWPTWARSLYPTAMASEVFLVRLRYWFPNGGRMILKVWGRMTRRSMVTRRSPRAWAASV